MKICLVLCFLLGTAHGDLLKKKSSGTIEAVGTFRDAIGGTIRWVGCDGMSVEYRPSHDYLLKRGKNDCTRRSSGADANSNSQNGVEGTVGHSKGKGAADKGWEEINDPLDRNEQNPKSEPPAQTVPQMF